MSEKKVNQVIVNGEELINLRNDTVSPQTLVKDETATNKEGEKIVGELDPVSHNEAYLIDDPEGDIDDSDYIPFNDVSDEEEPKKKTLFSSILDKLRSIFATKTGDNITDNNDKDTFRQNIHTLEWLGTDIPDNSDLDTYTTAGNYRVVSDGSGATIANLPLALCGKVIVFNNGNSGIEQFYFANHSPRIFVRTKFGSEAWSAWKEIGEGGDSKPHTYEVGTDIPANSDLNTYITDGVYRIAPDATAQTIANMPCSYVGKLVVMGGLASDANISNYKIQIFYRSDNSAIYTRSTTDGGSTWRAWLRLSFFAPKTYTVDGVNVDGCELDGTASNNTRGLLKFGQVANHIVQNFHNGTTWSGEKTLANLDDIKTHTYETGEKIPANSDLNTYLTAGSFYIALDTDATTIANMPVASSGKLIVVATTDVNTYRTQLFFDTASYDTYIRFYNPNSETLWFDWRKMATKNDISPSEIGNGYAVATVSGSAITATISGFQLRAGVIVALKISNFISTACTLNINSTGAKQVLALNNSQISEGYPIVGAYVLYTFMYDGTNYRILSWDATPSVQTQNYVADTSGNIVMNWGYDANKAQIKYNLSNNKLQFNYYKNSAWRGDYNIVDEYGRQTMSGWLGLKTNGGRTIASGAHSLAVSDTIPNIFNELRYSNGAWGSFNLTTAYTKDYTTIPTGWYNYFYIPHRVGGENWAQPTSWDADNVQYGTLLLFGMNNTNGMFRLRWANGSVIELEDVQKGNCYVGTCTTEGATKDKVATVDGNFVLRKGVRVAIKFTNSNTYNSQPTSPVTLNVNNTGAKNIWGWSNHSGAGNTGTNQLLYGNAGRYKYYVYDGTYWVYDGQSGDENSTNFLRNDASSTLTTSTPVLTIKASNIDLTQANNGVTSTQYPAYTIVDKNGKTMARFEAITETNGNISSFLYAGNIKTSDGTHFNGGIKLIAKKDGSFTWNITGDKASFHNNIGIGYCTCSTAEATLAKTATLKDYALCHGSMVIVHFSYNVPANSTLNINGQGAKAIYYRTVAIKDNVIKGGDKVTLIYDGTNYHVINIDRTAIGRHDCITMSNLKWGTVASTLVKTDNNYTVRGDIIGGVLYFNMEINFKANGTLPAYASENGGIFMIPNITTFRWRMAHAEYNNSYISCYTTSTTYDGSTGLMFMLRRTLAVTTGTSFKVCFEVPVNGGVNF